LFNIFINDLCAKIHFSEFLLIADLKIFRIIKSAEDCKLPQSDSVQEWCTENYMNIYSRAIFFLSLVKVTVSILITILV
jgi:hypothetical protein